MSKIKSYSLPDAEVVEFEKLLHDIGCVDRWSDSKIILEAVKEYGHRHLPGNPQLVIPNYIPQLKTPFSESAREKLTKTHTPRPKSYAVTNTLPNFNDMSDEELQAYYRGAKNGNKQIARYHVNKRRLET